MRGNFRSKKGKLNPMYGKHHTDDTKRKIGEANYKGGSNRVKSISMYIDFINPLQVLWRQKISENGLPQGLGFFQISRVGKATLEKRRELGRKYRPIMEAKRKGFGYIELNEKFEGSEGHHIDKEYVLYIPTSLHKSVSHNVFTGHGMEEINELAINYAYGVEL